MLICLGTVYTFCLECYLSVNILPKAHRICKIFFFFCLSHLFLVISQNKTNQKPLHILEFFFLNANCSESLQNPVSLLVARGVEPANVMEQHSECAMQYVSSSLCPQPLWTTCTEHKPGYLDAATQWAHSATATPVQLSISHEWDNQCELNVFA